MNPIFPVLTERRTTYGAHQSFINHFAVGRTVPQCLPANPGACAKQSLLIQASVTKSLVAMAIMKLAEQGTIDLDESVTIYLPSFTMADERYKEITVSLNDDRKANHQYNNRRC